MSDGTPSQLCVVLGAPRSGTTWLQRLLAMSRHVASPQETHLFWLYLQPQHDAWRGQAERLRRALDTRSDAQAMTGRLVGLPSLLAERDLHAAQRALVDRLVDHALATRPGATTVVEKSPSNALCVDVIREVCPTARLVHIVRDPRDVMRSALHASSGWGERWAPADPRSAARMWVRHVQGARRGAAAGPELYHELRYEDLRRDPTASLEPLLRFLGLDDDPAELVARERVAEPGSSGVFAFGTQVRERLAELPDRASEPPGFGNTGGRAPLTRNALHAARVIAGPTAASLGYDLGPPVSAGVRHVSVAALTGQTYAVRARRAAQRRIHSR